MSLEPIAVENFGDRAVLLRFDGTPSAELTSLLRGLAEAAARLPGVVDAAPGLTTVLIESNRASPDELRRLVPELMGSAQPMEGRTFEVRVSYQGEDLKWVCTHLGMDRDELVTRHSAPTYDVRLLGSPGFIYLSDVPPEIAVPRLEEPRQHVPAGSVGVGGSQTGIYGRPRPGGWRILGSALEVPPVGPGDRVKFVPA